MLAVTKFVSISKFLFYFDKNEASHSFRRLIEAARNRYSEKKVSRNVYILFKKYLRRSSLFSKDAG